jgi:hypothetical protein
MSEALTTVSPEESESTDAHPLESLIPQLRPADRCDCGGCSAQAFYAVLFTADNTEPLLFCRHHYLEHESAITAKNPLAIRDDSHTLNEKPNQ